MPKWTYADVERLMTETIGAVDGDDPKAKKRLRILEAATELFIATGYRKTSVDDIAERAGVAKGTVYLYFNTKVELLVSAVALEKRQYMTTLAPVLAEGVAPRERLQKWISTVLVLGTKMPLTAKLLRQDRDLQAVFDEMPAELVQQHDSRGIDFIVSLVDEAASPHRFSASELADRGRVLASLGYFARFLHDERVRGELSIERFADTFASMLVNGLAAHPVASPAGPGKTS